MPARGIDVTVTAAHMIAISEAMGFRPTSYGEPADSIREMANSPG